tara:strand:+ start:837 stop:959 length:123 start_codon:yes stop_codon:yes gene_type:complete
MQALEKKVSRQLRREKALKINLNKRKKFKQKVKKKNDSSI